MVRNVEISNYSNHLFFITLTFIIMTGIIKKLTTNGFGFITGEGLSKDLFFHSKGLVNVTFDELKEGDAVSFETEETPKGLTAINVQRA